MLIVAHFEGITQQFLQLQALRQFLQRKQNINPKISSHHLHYSCLQHCQLAAQEKPLLQYVEKIISYCYCVTIFVLTLLPKCKTAQVTARDQRLLYIFHLPFDKELLGRLQLKMSTCFRSDFVDFLYCCLKELLTKQDFSALTLSVLLSSSITQHVRAGRIFMSCGRTNSPYQTLL